jgi:hypothetical protein
LLILLEEQLQKNILNNTTRHKCCKLFFYLRGKLECLSIAKFLDQAKNGANLSKTPLSFSHLPDFTLPGGIVFGRL